LKFFSEAVVFDSQNFGVTCFVIEDFA